MNKTETVYVLYVSDFALGYFNTLREANVIRRRLTKELKKAEKALKQIKYPEYDYSNKEYQNEYSMLLCEVDNNRLDKLREITPFLYKICVDTLCGVPISDFNLKEYRFYVEKLTFLGEIP